MTSEHHMAEDERAEQSLRRLMDDIEAIAAVVEGAKGSDELAGNMTMWLDYMVHRALRAEDGENEA